MNSAYERESAFVILAGIILVPLAIAAWLLFLARHMSLPWKILLRVFASLCVLFVVLFVLAGVFLPWGHIG